MAIMGLPVASPTALSDIQILAESVFLDFP